MQLNWNFQRGERVQMNKPSVGEEGIFSGTTQCYVVLVLFLIVILGRYFVTSTIVYF